MIEWPMVPEIAELQLAVAKLANIDIAELDRNTLYAMGYELEDVIETLESFRSDVVVRYSLPE